MAWTVVIVPEDGETTRREFASEGAARLGAEETARTAGPCDMVMLEHPKGNVEQVKLADPGCGSPPPD